jgi:hypothetical protein
MSFEKTESCLVENYVKSVILKKIKFQTSKIAEFSNVKKLLNF